MTLILSALLLLGGSAGAAAGAGDAGTADKTTVDIVEYFLKTPTSEANPKLIDPFMAVNAETLPKKLRAKAEGKQIEIRALIRLHDAKKKGKFIPPPTGDCSEKDFVLPLSKVGIYKSIGYEEIDEKELDYVMSFTNCTEIDLGCRFTMKIFFDKKKPRRLMFHQNDPIMGVVAASHGVGGGSHLFGSGLSCLH